MFEPNGVYRNRTGEYTVLAVNGPRMTVRYTDGSEAELNVNIQARIWENIVAEQEAKAASSRHMRQSNKDTTHYIKAVSLPPGEELAFPGFRRAARLNRADVVAVPLDGEGIVPEALDAACRRTGARLLCVTPEAQNPTAGRMSLGRRRRIAEIAALHDLQIIEDDCYSVAEPSAPAIRALAPDRTWYVTSLSKAVSAGLRVGAIVCPTGNGESGRIAAQHSFFGLSLPLAEIALRLFTSGEAARLRDAGQAVFARRLELLLNILGRHEMRWQMGLSFVWLPLPRGWRGSTFAREAEAAGVLIRSADEYALVDGHAPNAVRIALDGEVAEPRFIAAIETLARLLDNPPADIPV